MLTVHLSRLRPAVCAEAIRWITSIDCLILSTRSTW